jgi:uncharacterized protein (TIGR03083 family)
MTEISRSVVSRGASERRPMTKAGIAGMACAAEEIFTIAETLTYDEWHTPSAASGWSVGDVICHVGCLLELLQAAVRGDSLPDSRIEALNDTQVAQRRHWEPARVLDYVHTQLDSALPVFTTLQDEPLASVQTPMLDLGSYALRAIPDMFTFDMTTHLRYDILSPRGPITRDLPPLDDVRLAPSVSWLLGGIPQMQPELVHHLSAPLALRLTGAAAQDVFISADEDVITVRPLDCAAINPAATLTSTTPDFLAWSTTRLPWQQLVSIDGNTTVAAAFLDALNLI